MPRILETLGPIAPAFFLNETSALELIGHGKAVRPTR